MGKRKEATARRGGRRVSLEPPLSNGTELQRLRPRFSFSSSECF